VRVKVCLLTSVHSAFDIRIFHKEAKTLAKAGYDVTLIAHHNKNEIVDGVNIVALHKPKSRFVRIFGITWRVFYLALCQHADAYHFHDPELIFIGMLLKLFGKKVIYDVHEDVPRQILTKHWIPCKIRPFLGKLIKFVESISALGFNGIITVTPSIAKNFPKHKTIIVQNFPILNEFSQFKADNYSQRKSIIIYIGTISSLRGAKEMVEAMDLLPREIKSYLILMGKFSYPNLKNELKKIGGWDKVNFMDWQPRKYVEGILLKARVGLVPFHPVPNHIESQPNKFFEYMAAGIPIVVSDFPVWRKFVEDSGCGILVDPLNPNDIAHAIQWLLEHPDQAAAMGRRGQEAVKFKYNWENEAKKLIKFYKNLL